jgi:hypothetical protein
MRVNELMIGYWKEEVLRNKEMFAHFESQRNLRDGFQSSPMTWGRRLR